MALLRLAVDWAREHDVQLRAVTVDHGLRPEASHEAMMVAQTCAALDVKHSTLTWSGWDGRGNLQDRARVARYDLIAGWAARQNISVVLLGHTIEDQAETFLMRLARASGVDGLSSMADLRVGETRFLRPLLSCRRADLRAYLRKLGQEWVEDPSNLDHKYDRVKIRAQRAALEDLGLSAQNLSEVAQNMAQAREALNWAAHQFAQDHVRLVGPDVTIPIEPFLGLPQELGRRLLVHALRWLSGAAYAPRRAAVMALMTAIRVQTPMTLHGCRVTYRKGHIWVFRELSAVTGQTCVPGQIWDKRWLLDGPTNPGDVIAPLGMQGQAMLKNWRETGRLAASVQADPGVWRDGRLIAAPLSNWPNGWRADPANPQNDFYSALLSH